jgi:hypothetical protein
MLGQSKTISRRNRCGLRNRRFLALHVHYAQELLGRTPFSDHTMWNQLEYRGLEGFVYAVTPFNFTSIAANLPTAPALMGNTVVWKPASSAMYSAYYLMKLYEAAGMPPGVINMVAGRRRDDFEGAAQSSRIGRRALYRQHRSVQRHVEDDRRVDVLLPLVSAHRRRNRRQGLYRRPPIGGRGRARGGDRSRRIRVPGPEVFGCQPRLRTEIAVERGSAIARAMR